MPLYKTFQKYPDFEKWVKRHKYSVPPIASEIKELMEYSDDDPEMFLRGYIINLRSLRHEIMGEIREAKSWIEYFQKKGRG
jgi:hypothetical protein